MKEFIKVDGNIVVNVPYAEAYIPESLFRDVEKESEVATSVAYMNGDGVSTIGVFNMRFFQSDTDPREKSPLRTFSYPTQIDTYPSKITKERMILTTADKDAADDDDPEGDDEMSTRYYVLHYYKGDIMMSVSTEAKVANCEKYLETLTRGKLPNSIPYSHMADIWMDNFELNDTNPGVPSVIMQCIIAEQCRWAKDPKIPFRKMIGKGKANENEYIMANMRTLASYNSTFAAMTFEDIGQMICSSINMTRQNTPQNKSPIEKVLSY